MKGIGGGQVILVIAGVLSLALLAIWGLLESGAGEWSVPSPEGTANSFVSAMSAHRYHGAAKQLSSQLSYKISELYLKEITSQIEDAYGGIQDSLSLDSDLQGHQARARVQVTLGDGSEEVLEFPMVRENWVWKVDGLAPVEMLAAER
jgi:hypothetical protein